MRIRLRRDGVSPERLRRRFEVVSSDPHALLPKRANVPAALLAPGTALTNEEAANWAASFIYRVSRRSCVFNKAAWGIIQTVRRPVADISWWIDNATKATQEQFVPYGQYANWYCTRKVMLRKLLID